MRPRGKTYAEMYMEQVEAKKLAVDKIVEDLAVARAEVAQTRELSDEEVVRLVLRKIGWL